MENRIDGKCSKCDTEFTKIVDAKKSFRDDGTRYIFSDDEHEYNKAGMVYDIFRCSKCSSVIDESFVEIQADYIEKDTNDDIDIHKVYNKLSDDEKEEMAHLLSDDVDILDFIGGDNRQNMYKELAYYVGVSDVEHLEYLIKELQYWSKK